MVRIVDSFNIELLGHMFSATMSCESQTTYMLNSDEIRVDERDSSHSTQSCSATRCSWATIGHGVRRETAQVC